MQCRIIDFEIIINVKKYNTVTESRTFRQYIVLLLNHVSEKELMEGYWHAIGLEEVDGSTETLQIDQYFFNDILQQIIQRRNEDESSESSESSEEEEEESDDDFDEFDDFEHANDEDEDRPNPSTVQNLQTTARSRNSTRRVYELPIVAHPPRPLQPVEMRRMFLTSRELGMTSSEMDIERMGNREERDDNDLETGNLPENLLEDILIQSILMNSFEESTSQHTLEEIVVNQENDQENDHYTSQE